MSSDPLSTLIHDVNSKCASLKSAAALLRASSPKEAKELLSLMTQQARSLAADIAEFEAGPASK
jgi:hypothetical protein